MSDQEAGTEEAGTEKAERQHVVDDSSCTFNGFLSSWDPERPQRRTCSAVAKSILPGDVLKVYKRLLIRYQAEGEAFLHRIVTCDETWVHHYTMESKQASMVAKEGRIYTPSKSKLCSQLERFLQLYFLLQRSLHIGFGTPSLQSGVIALRLLHVWTTQRNTWRTEI